MHKGENAWVWSNSDWKILKENQSRLLFIIRSTFPALLLSFGTHNKLNTEDSYARDW